MGTNTRLRNTLFTRDFIIYTDGRLDPSNNNNPPVYSEDTTTRDIAENTPASTNIGTAVSATDANNDSLRYSLTGTDAAFFSLNFNNGRLKTKDALDHETKDSYRVTVNAFDNKGGSDSITVTINVNDVNEAPTFASGASISNITATEGEAITSVTLPPATDPDDGASITYTVTPALPTGLTFTDSTRILAGTPTVAQTSTTYTYKASDGSLSNELTFTIVVNATSNNAPVFTDGASTTRSVAENTASGQNIGTAVGATDADTTDTLTYSLGGTDAASFSIVSTSGQLQTNAALNFESKTSYSVTITVDDGNGANNTDTITVTINVTNVNEAPTLPSGRVIIAVDENTASDTNIGTAFTATDPDSGDTLTYSLRRGDASSFSIDSSTGQLKTNAALDFETKSSYSDLVVRATDSGSLFAARLVTVNVNDINEAPAFASGASISNITATVGTAITSVTLPEATDPESNTITYTLTPALPAGLTFTDSSRILAGTPTAVKASATYTYTASDGNLSDTLTFTIAVSAAPNNAPVFTDGDSTTRSVAENTVSGTNIGTAVGATDADNDTLTYTLGGTDSASFSIVSTSGQLQTNAALNHESKSSYSVTVSVSDGKGGTDSIPVTITVTNVNEAPAFANNASISNITATTNTAITSVTLPEATDPDGTTPTYTLTPALPAGLTFTASTRALAGTPTAAKTSTTYTYTASDGSLSATLTFTIAVNAPANNAPVFTDGDSTTREIAENTASGTNIGTAVGATDADNDTLTYTLGGTDADSFSIVSTSGQLRTSAALDYETKTSYSVTITVSDGTSTDSISVTINVTNVNEAPSFADGTSTTRNILEGRPSGTNIGTAVTATDPDTGDVLTYTLGGTDASSFSIVSTSGQLQTNAVLDSETKSSYSVTVSVSDGNGGSDSISVTINVTDVNEAPTFADGSSTTRSIAENTASGTNIGTAVTATDPDADALTYSLSGTDASAFSIVSTSGQIQTSAALDYETKNAYSVTVSVSDGNGGIDSITVAINVTNANDAPRFIEGASTTRSIAENTATSTNIGSAVAATDQDGDPIIYTLGGTDASAFSIVSTSGQLRTSAALDYEAKNVYSVTVSVSDGNGGSDSITVTIDVTDVNEIPTNNAPIFTEGDTATRSIAENTAAGTNIGTPIAATDADNDPLTYMLSGTDAASFSIVSTSGQLQTGAALDYETKNAYSVTVSVSDGKGGTDSITVTINVTDVPETPTNNAPIFTEGDTTTRTIAENTAAGTNIGTPIAATDADNDPLTYMLIGDTDAAAFSCAGKTGQLQTRTALDYETKSSYVVIVYASDGKGGTDSITVTINVTDVPETPTNNAPIFTEGDTTTRTIAENTASGENIGTPVSATDPDGDTLTYSFGGTDAAAFSCAGKTGQLQTRTALDYETKSSYVVIVYASDGKGGTDSITVTINVTDVPETPTNNAPIFTEGDTTTRTIAENTAAGTNIGTAVAAWDQDYWDVLTYTLGGTDAASFSIVNTSGQLQTKVALDYETKSSYAVVVSVSDGNGGSASITVTIHVTDVYEPVTDPPPPASNSTPVFTEGTSTSRSVTENTASDENIGDPISATDPDGDTITYTLGGTDAALFGIDSSTGQLRTAASLDYETQASYSVVVFASDGRGGTASITVTINVTDVYEPVPDPPSLLPPVFNSAPIFTEGTSTSRSVTENTASDENIGDPISATDPDGDTITYTLGGTDAALFGIDSSTGQLRTAASLDYETQASYSVVVFASDSNGGLASITVTINVTDVADAETPGSVGGTDIGVSCQIFTLTATDTDEPQRPPMYWVDADVGVLRSLTGSNVSHLVPDVQNATSVAVDRADGKIYWTEQTSYKTGRIRRANLNGTNVELVRELTSVPRGLALDVSNGKLYLTNAWGKVQRMNLDGTGFQPNLIVDLDAPKGVAVDAVRGKIYWTEQTSYKTGRIRRANLNGTNVELVRELTSVPRGLAIDARTNKLYLTSSVGKVQRLNGDGTNFTPNFIVNLDSPMSIAVDAVDGKVYWTEGGRIRRANPNGTNVQNVAAGLGTPVSLVLIPEAVAVSIDASLRPPMYWHSQAGALQRLTGAEVESIAPAAENITGIAVDARGGNVYWTEQTSNKTGRIRRANPNGTNIQLVRELTSVPRGLAIDTSNNKLYLTTATGKVQRMNLDGTGSQPNLIVDLDAPRGVAIDATGGKVYWTEQTSYKTGRIRRANLNGTNIQLVKALTSVPRGLAIDTSNNKLYLTNAWGKVQRMNLDGTGFQPNLIVDLDAPKGVAVDAASGKVYWTEQVGEDRGRVQRADLDGSNVASVRELNNVPNGIAVDGSNGKLYVTNDQGRIQRMNLNGKSYEWNFITNLDSPQGIAVDVAAGKIYWTEADKIRRANLDGSNRQDVVTGIGSLAGIALSVAPVNNDAPAAPGAVAATSEATALHANYPNPFNPETWIPYQLQHAADVTVTIYDLRGTIVRQLLLGHQPAGVYHSRSRAAHWDGRNALGEPVASGVYFYTITAGDFTATRKMLIRK